MAIHLPFLDCFSLLAEEGRISAETPLDVSLLYRATVAAFFDPSIDDDMEWLPATGRIVNRERAQQRLATLPEGRILRLALRFADAVTRQSDESPREQDLLLHLDLFLTAIERATPEMIESGEISRASSRLQDPDYW